MLQVHNGFAGLECVLKHPLLSIELIIGVIGRLDAQADPALRGVNLDDAGSHFIAGLEHVFNLLNALFADLADVYQPFQAAGQFDKGAERRQLDHLALDEVAHPEMLVDVAPRIFAELFEAER